MRRLAAPLALLLAACAPAIPAPSQPRPVIARAPSPRPSITASRIDAPLAEPRAFPEGWIRGAAASPLDPTPRSLARLAEASRKPILAVTPSVVRVADLPRVEVEPEPDWDKPPSAIPPVQRLDDVFVNGRYLTFRGKPFGVLESSFLSGAGGVGVWCGSATGLRRAAWQTLAMRPDGAMQYRGAVAWFDYQACAVHLVARVESPARDVAGGLAYAFRTACPRCKEGGEVLHVLAPVSVWGNVSFTHQTFPMRPGDGRSSTMTLTDTAIRAWRETGAAPSRTRPTRLGVEVAQVTGEAEPVLVIYVTDALPGMD